jgi:dUTP pyrophosphatase
MKIKFKKLHPDAKMPQKAHDGDVGFDLTATSCHIDEYGNYVYGFGIALEIPKGYGGFLYPRSSLSKYTLVMKGHVGVIDAGYRGEITGKFHPDAFGEEDITVYNVGDRAAQLVIQQIPDVEFEEVDELSETDRGTGSYGSTGK